VLLQAMRLLDLDVSCWVAGDGPDTDQLRIEHAGDTRIEWLGRIDEPDKLARLRAASVVCAPSLHGESFGVVLIEAMAAGTPVVASAIDGYRNVATDGVDALLVEPGNAFALAAALERVLCDPALAAALVAKGSDRADGFSMSRLADEYVAIYERLSSGPTP
jgi:phosphatidylinositol alpha-mannosyltransferase